MIRTDWVGTRAKRKNSSYMGDTLIVSDWVPALWQQQRVFVKPVLDNTYIKHHIRISYLLLGALSLLLSFDF